MTRVSQLADGVQSAVLCLQRDRLSTSLPLTTFRVNPSRRPCAIAPPTPTRPAAEGPDARAKLSPVEIRKRHRCPIRPVIERWTGADHVDHAGQRVPPEQRTLWSANEFDLVDIQRSMLDVFELSCGTPSKFVVMAGLAGLEPIPRNRGLLSLRAVKSESRYSAHKSTPRARCTPAPESVSCDTAVTLTARWWVGGFLCRHHYRWQLDGAHRRACRILGAHGGREKPIEKVPQR